MQRCTDQQPSDRGGLGFALRQYGERKRRSLGKKSEILHVCEDQESYPASHLAQPAIAVRRPGVGQVRLQHDQIIGLA